jgi:hypothetical protein
MHAHAACAEKNRNVGELDREYRKRWHHPLQIARCWSGLAHTRDRRSCQRIEFIDINPGARQVVLRPYQQNVLGDKRSRKPETRIPKSPFHVQSRYSRAMPCALANASKHAMRWIRDPCFNRSVLETGCHSFTLYIRAEPFGTDKGGLSEETSVPTYLAESDPQLSLKLRLDRSLEWRWLRD